MIVVNAIIETSEENIDLWKEGITAIENASRKESGCIDYTWSVELNSSNTLRATEKWKSMDDLALHFQTPHIFAFQEMVSEDPPKITASFYEVKEVPPPGSDLTLLNK